MRCRTSGDGCVANQGADGVGMGLRVFSMHPSQILEVKQHVLKSEVAEIAPQVRKILRYSEPEKIREQIDKLNA